MRGCCSHHAISFAVSAHDRGDFAPRQDALQFELDRVSKGEQFCPSGEDDVERDPDHNASGRSSGVRLPCERASP
jgi:hypothetical protein